MPLANKSGGVVYLTKDVEELNICEMTIIPNKGQAEGQFNTRFRIELHFGITIGLKKQILWFRTTRRRNVA